MTHPSMTRSPILSQTFHQTTINPASVQAYLLSYPRYYSAGYVKGANVYALQLLNNTDYFEWQLRRYLASPTKTLRGVFREIRAFQGFHYEHACEMITFSLAAVGETILVNEWYELMPRYQLARQRIEKRFGIDRYLRSVNSDVITCLQQL
ncbi:hypothetical protein [Spirosoma koreense]